MISVAQLNFSTTATLGTEERSGCREVLNKSQCMDFCLPGRKIVAFAEKWMLAKVSTLFS